MALDLPHRHARAQQLKGRKKGSVLAGSFWRRWVNLVDLLSSALFNRFCQDAYASQNHVVMSRIERSRPCFAKAVSLSKVTDFRRAGLIRPKTASMTEMVSAAVFPATRAANVTRDFRSCRTRTGRMCLQMIGSPSQWPTSARAHQSLWADRGLKLGLEGLARRARRRLCRRVR